MEKYYKYNGSLHKCEIKEILIVLISKSAYYKNPIKINDEFSKVLSDDEFIDIKLNMELKPGIFSGFILCGVACGPPTIPSIFKLPFPLIIPIINVNINIRATTLTILALLLDIDMTKGFLSGFLALSGFNNRAFSKIDEYQGEKCLLIEICSKQKHKLNVHNLDDFCEKECVNNNLRCKYRTEGKCLMKIQEAIEKCNSLTERNVLRKSGEFYFYILVI